MLIAHGMGSEDDNNRVLDAMQDAADALRSAGYGEVHAATLREDWDEPRAEAERHIRATVAEMAERRDHVVVIPYRISGFGPYGDVLDGLDYVPRRRTAPAPSGHGMDRLPRNGQFLRSRSGVAAWIMRDAVGGGFRFFPGQARIA